MSSLEIRQLRHAEKRNPRRSSVTKAVQASQIHHVLTIALINLVHGAADGLTFFIVKKSKSVQFIGDQVKEPYSDMNGRMLRALLPQLAKMVLQSHRVAAGMNIPVRVPACGFVAVLDFPPPVCECHCGPDSSCPQIQPA